MALTAAQIEASINNLNLDITKWHQIVHGNDSTTVSTEAGNVPTVAKAIKDSIQTAGASAITTFNTSASSALTNFATTAVADLNTFANNSSAAITTFNTNSAAAISAFSTSSTTAIATFNTNSGNALTAFASDTAAVLTTAQNLNTALANGPFRTFSTWAELTAVAGTYLGQKAQVFNDAGTHTDPVTGTTLTPNKGTFGWSVSPAGWKYISANSEFAFVSDESGYTFAIEDANQRLGFGIDTAGNTFLKLRHDASVPETALETGTQNKLLKSITSGELNTESGFIWAIEDSLHRVGMGLKPDGTLWARLSDDSVFPTTLYASTAIACYGDSLTQGTGGNNYLTAFMADLPNRSVVNRGTGGHTSQQIAVRQGGIPFLVTVTGNEVPASGPVTLTARSHTPITNQGPSSYTGILGGVVAGTMAASTGDGGATYTYTFTRTTPGAAISIAPNSQFVFDTALADRDKTAVIWVGRNDGKTSRTQQLAIRDNILLMNNYLSSLAKRFLVVSVTNGTAEGNPSASYTAIIALNKELQATYGDRFVDLRRYLIDFGLADAGLTPTTDDTADIASDTVPRQLMTDGVHFTAAGYTLVGKYLARQIRARGW